MKYKSLFICILIKTSLISTSVLPSVAQEQVPIVPSSNEINRPFGNHDKESFKLPPKVYHPETWFHYIGGNVAKEGITADLEAIAKAGISGIQLFHGQFGGPWPGVDPQIVCLSPSWESTLQFTAEECRRLGLRFTMLNCPGWAMSGGPWIEESNAMRHLAWSRTDVVGGKGTQNQALAMPQPSSEPWRDYNDITVLAFPTPEGDTGKPLKPESVKSNWGDLPWEDYLLGEAKESFRFPPTTEENPHWLEVTFPDTVTVRTVEFPSINSLNHSWCYDPGVKISVQAILPNGETKYILNSELPQSNWQDDYPISFACPEVKGVKKYRISIVNKHVMNFGSLRLFTAARKNNWESEAGWTLRSIERSGDQCVQSPAAFIDPSQVRDITAMMDENGNLKWNAPAGKWTILRIGHVNSGMQNGPAPAEGTGWECNKLSKTGAEVQFANYIGRLAGKDGPFDGGLLQGILFDSWECRTQTWTPDMEAEFEGLAEYPLRKWLPAVFGYVVGDQETTSKFLHDWRATLNDLFSNNFYGRMAELAKENNLAITYETSAGDVFPADILEYFKHADVPMCEFWQPMSDSFVGSINFKSIKPTASAARLYGKPRVAAEAFTNISLSWDEHLNVLKEVGNINSIEGVSHLVFHTYTHNPRTDFLLPGTSFGAGIGTPFLRGQTWWKHMPEFTDYFARCSYLLERGKPVSDVLWYLGDEVNHKPDQNAPFPEGLKYDYCNPDILLNRLTVDNGLIVTPEGISYRVLWLPEAPRMLPQTLEKLYSLISQGATVIGNAPQEIVTLTGGKEAQKRFNTAVENIWGKTPKRGINKVGKGTVISGMTIFEAVKALKITPDVTGGNALWTHRKIDGADWYFVCAPKGEEFHGTLDFRSTGNVELWDPVMGTAMPIESFSRGDRTLVPLDLPQAGACFIVFNHTEQSKESFKPIRKEFVSSIPLTKPWNLSFPEGWDAPASIQIPELKAWKELDVSPEAKAFSGSAIYKTTFDINELKTGTHFSLDLGSVDMIAVVSLNGTPLRTLWAPPYSIDITDAVKNGTNSLTIEVTSTWFNRLVYDAGLREDKRKTWTINGPSKEAPLRNTGLLGPVVISVEKEI